MYFTSSSLDQSALINSLKVYIKFVKSFGYNLVILS